MTAQQSRNFAARNQKQKKMSTTKNNTANYTVENLVAKYRNYVHEHCPKIACGDEYQDEDGVWHYSEGFYLENFDTEEQLLITLYNRVAGDNADKRIVEALSKYADDFYADALDESELSFLAEHFSDVSTLAFENLHYQGWFDESVLGKNARYILENAYKPESGSTIFIADSGYCDVAMLFPECIIKGYTTDREFDNDNEIWALGQIRLYAAGIRTEILSSDEVLSPDYIRDVDYAIWGTAHISSYEDAEMLFQHMKEKSKILIFMDKNDAARTINGSVRDTYGLRKGMVEKRIIGSIISFEDDDELRSIQRNKICILGSTYSHAEVHMYLSNGDEFAIPSDTLDHEILWPSYYAAQKPEAGIPLSSIASFVNQHEWDEYHIDRKGGKFNLSEKIKKMPVAVPADMVTDYKDANLCEINLKLVENPIFEKKKRWIRKISQPCVLLYGRGEKYVSGYVMDLPKNGIATLDTIACLVPKDGIDVRYLAALLLSPEVRDQIMLTCAGDVNNLTFPFIINKVIVPNHDEKERLAFLSEANYKALISSKKEMEKSFNEKFDAAKTEYINEVRMRKHDMGQYIFELQNTEDLMRYYLENRDKEENFCSQIETLLDSFRSSLAELSTMLDNLSKEESFDKPVHFSVSDYFSKHTNRHEGDGYKTTYHLDEASVRDYANQYATKENSKDVNMVIAPSISIAPSNFYRLVSNILDNAKKHGFTESARKDYEVKINVSIDTLKNMYVIDFRNNGNPLPKGIDKMRYGIKGEKAGKFAGTGIGGNYVKTFVEHYGGDYDVFMDNGWVVIRICLPIK